LAVVKAAPAWSDAPAPVVQWLSQWQAIAETSRKRPIRGCSRCRRSVTMPQFEARIVRLPARRALNLHDVTKLGCRVSTRSTGTNVRQRAIARDGAVHYSLNFDRDDRT
jgi:hypothetical protein